MRWRKFLIFLMTIFSITVVVFNNMAQLINEMFFPQFNIRIGIGFCILIIGVIFYVVINKNMFKR